MNKVIMLGNIMAKSDCVSYYPARDGKKAVVSFPLTVQRPFAKKNDQGFYPSDIFTVKGFDKAADFVHDNFAPGKAIYVEGYMAIEPAHEANGVTYPAKTVIIASSFDFVPRDRNIGGSEAASTANTTVTHAARAVNLGVKAPAPAASAARGGLKLF